ncbi:MAG: Sec-independent protein translocase TatB [Pseudoclavibacter sp.]|nr:Sec-independent protein translocase TatB [Pseudoclavibacter sp.]
MFGLTFEKLLIIGVIAAFLIGPERLPAASERLRDFVRWLRGMSDDAKQRMREEMGEEFDEVDWRKLDPRQYDPRRIIRDALLEEPARPAAPAAAAAGASRPAWAEGAAGAAQPERPDPDAVPPYDPEAT